PGTVSWKIGYQLYRDEPVSFDGSELTPAQLSRIAQQKRTHSNGSNDCDLDGNGDQPGGCRLRFDTNRRDFFHYVLFAHARGMPKNSCLIIKPDGGVEKDEECRKNDPLFHVPTSASGVSDLPGGDSMVTLGFWDNFVGTDYF